MSATLEHVQEPAPEPAIKPEPAIEPAPEQVPEPEPVSEPKKRGKPKTAANAKAQTPKKAVKMKPPSPVSSDDEQGDPLTRDDMATLLSDYLAKRKQSQQNARRTMWAQLVGLL